MNNHLVAGCPTTVWLRDESRVSGKALEVKPDGLRIHITKVHGSSKYVPGELLLPASEIAKLHVNRTGSKGRIIGTAIGGTITGLIIFGVAMQGYDASVTAGVAAAGLAPTAIGYLLGWVKDYRVTKVNIIPEASKTRAAAPSAGSALAPMR